MAETPTDNLKLTAEQERMLRYIISVEDGRIATLWGGPRHNAIELCGLNLAVAVMSDRYGKIFRATAAGRDLLSRLDALKSAFRAGDVVKHGPTGETWTLACADDRGHVYPCGWPPTRADAADCTLVTAASDAQHREMLEKLAANPAQRDDGYPDDRVENCRQQLSRLDALKAVEGVELTDREVCILEYFDARREPSVASVMPGSWEKSTDALQGRGLIRMRPDQFYEVTGAGRQALRAALAAHQKSHPTTPPAIQRDEPPLGEYGSAMVKEAMKAAGKPVEMPTRGGETMDQGTAESLAEAAEKLKAAYATSPPQIAWVIEHQDSPPGAPKYFTGNRHGAIQWTDPGDHDEACRLARKQDAERIAHFAGFYPPNPEHHIREHVWLGAAPSPLQPREQTGALAEMEKRKDAAYLERNQVVAALAAMAIRAGGTAGIARTAIEGWSEDWHGCVYIDLPTGQASWHYHDSQAHLFAWLPPYAKPYDGHSTEEKYMRLVALSETPQHSTDGWISVGERMPELDCAKGSRSALMLVVENGEVSTAYYYGTRWIAPAGSSLNVTHWRPLPAPPSSSPTAKAEQAGQKTATMFKVGDSVCLKGVTNSPVGTLHEFVKYNSRPAARWCIRDDKHYYTCNYLDDLESAPSTPASEASEPSAEGMAFASKLIINDPDGYGCYSVVILNPDGSHAIGTEPIHDAEASERMCAAARRTVALEFDRATAAMRSDRDGWKESAERHHADAQGLMRYRDQLERHLEDVKSIIVKQAHEDTNLQEIARLAAENKVMRKAMPDPALLEGVAGVLNSTIWPLVLRADAAKIRAALSSTGGDGGGNGR